MVRLCLNFFSLCTLLHWEGLWPFVPPALISKLLFAVADRFSRVENLLVTWVGEFLRLSHGFAVALLPKVSDLVDAVHAQGVGTFVVATSWTSVEVVLKLDMFVSWAVEPLAALHVGHLLLGCGLEDTIVHLRLWSGRKPFGKKLLWDGKAQFDRGNRTQAQLGNQRTCRP